MLDIDGLDVHYGGVHALRGLSLGVAEGEIVALLGNNGAGKTTTLAAVSGLLRPSGGRVVFDGREITGRKPHRITARGLVHVPEGRRIFSTLSVHENLQLGGYLVRDQAEIRRRIEHVYELLPHLAERRAQQGARCRAASSRCSPSAGRWSPPGCCCWTSRPWAWRRWWSPRS